MNSTTTFHKDPNKYYVMGTGSRSMRTDPNAQAIFERLITYVQMLAEKHDVMLISGMAEGWDEAIARTAIRLGIPFVAALPNEGYGKYYWQNHSVTGQDRYATFQTLLERAEHVEIVCDSLYVDGLHSNFVRNQWMVDHCDYALVFNAQSPGTRDAVARLRQGGKTFDVYPFSLQETLEI